MSDEDLTAERDRLNALAHRVIGAAIRVHKEIGPGMLESAYEACLMFELLGERLDVERQTPIPIVYRGHRLDCGYRIDLIVNGELVVEVKAIERVAAVHIAQMRSYLGFSHRKLGLVINFNVKWLKDGITRVVNGFPE
jgi:GxxExxY protein